MAEYWQHAGNMIIGTTAERGAFDTSTLRAGNYWFDTILNSFLLWDGVAWIHSFADDIETYGDIYILQDSKALKLGGGQDMDLYYDGADGHLRTDVVAASDLLVDCGAQKTIELQTTVYDDYVTPISPATFRGASNNPTLTKLFDDGAGSTGIWAYVFVNGDEVLVTVQLPHRWKEGTTIYPHIHFMCTSDVDPADNFGIEFEYTWADINEDFPANTTLTTTDISTGVNTDDMHQFANIPAAGINGAGHTISSVLLCRIKRVAAIADDYADGVAILDFDVHYEINTMGSRQISAK